MSWPRILCVLLLWSVAALLPADEDTSVTTITWPRDLGYRIGDRFEIVAKTVMAPGYSLDKTSLPRVGRVDRWVELTEVDVQTPSASTLSVRFRFLITGNPDTLSGLIVPPMHYLLKSGEKTWPVVVQAFGYSLSPILLHENRVDGQMPVLLAPNPPPAADISQAARLAWLGGAVMVLSALWLVWINWFRGAVPSWQRPFAVAARKLHTREIRSHYPEALKAVHRAFDSTDGRTVLSGDLDAFFDRHPHMKAEEMAIRDFFAHSNALFYEGQRDKRLRIREDLIALCRRCHALRVPRA